MHAPVDMHGTGRACRCLHELLALRRSAASTRLALAVDCGIFRKLPCLQTRYIVVDIPWGLESTRIGSNFKFSSDVDEIIPGFDRAHVRDLDVLATVLVVRL